MIPVRALCTPSRSGSIIYQLKALTLLPSSFDTISHLSLLSFICRYDDRR
jgi:hypothetical protein